MDNADEIAGAQRNSGDQCAFVTRDALTIQRCNDSTPQRGVAPTGLYALQRRRSLIRVSQKKKRRADFHVSAPVLAYLSFSGWGF